MHGALIDLFGEQFPSEKVIKIESIRPHGSSRSIARLKSKNRSVIGVENSDIKENHAFIYFSKHFKSYGLNVPEIYAANKAGTCYLQEDLGDSSLFDYLSSERSDKNHFPANVEIKYKEVLSVLPRFQIEAGKTIDYKHCHKFEKFGLELMLSDMRSFRDQYLLPTGAKFDSAKLEKDFQSFANFLSKVESNFFMYRDFQSRNVQLLNGVPYFIDYQGGCQGALQYDVASLLYQAQAQIPEESREKLLSHYIDSLQQYISLTKDQFLQHFYAFVILRIMQVLGTYGLRGLKEKKQYFIDSIDFALSNLEVVYSKYGLPVEMPEFENFVRGLK